jgi:hypothetical protein
VVRSLPSFVEDAESSSVADIAEVSCGPKYAGQTVNLSAIALYIQCSGHLSWSLPYPYAPSTGPSFNVYLDDNGNATAAVWGGPGCVPGESLVSAHLQAAPFTTVTTTFSVLSPRESSSGVRVLPGSQVEDDRYGSVATIVDMSYSPTPGNPVRISAAQLYARCPAPPHLVWVGPDAKVLATGTAEVQGMTLDGFGNTFVVILGGESCTPGGSEIEADLERVPFTTFTAAFWRLGEQLPAKIAVLGDSYASGEGTYNTESNTFPQPQDYYGGEQGGSSYPQNVIAGFNSDSASSTDHCHRSPFAAGPLLGATEQDFVACSGADIREVAKGSSKNGEISQLNKVLSPADSEVLLSASGDSLNFAGVLGECIEEPLHPRSDQQCKQKLDKELKHLPTVISELSNQLIKPIISKTHGATVVLIGYPHLFPDGGYDGGCNGITAQRQRYLNEATDKLDEAIERLATTYVGPGRVQFADTRPTFEGHAVCGDSYPYINDLQFTTGDPLVPPDNCPLDYGAAPNGLQALVCSQSFHPNTWGYIAEALMLSKMIRLPSNAPLFTVVQAACTSNPFFAGYCAGLPH